MAHENNRISVIMGIYNCEKTLAAAVESILHQTYTDWQLVLCDDGSTDGTYEVACAFRCRYPDRIVVIRNEENRKLACALNRCLAQADGAYIARMDGDDVSLPDRLEKQMEYLNAHPEVDLCGTAAQPLYDSGKRGKPIVCAEHPTEKTMYQRNPFNHATILARREVYDALGGYVDLPRTVRCEDRDFWYRFYLHGFCGANLPEVLYLVSENEASVRRRTVRSRWNLFRTELWGYGQMHYPPLWYYRPFLNLLKALVPKALMVRRLRHRQARELAE